ncbi:MAG: hypothetical protein ACKVY0_26215 [Prosthecobacter sp.]|uniref:hypothetical protein n=1 Tax=Prosthecobacter sp. TaxID=1965333 RepID=UPI003900AE7E
MNLVVSDTGPLLHLFQVGACELLAHWGTIHVTPQVWSELHRHAPAFSAHGIPTWIRRCQLSSAASRQAAQWTQARMLDAGEAEALAYAKEIQADVFLTDDTAARTLSVSLGIQARGSLGVVLFGAAAGHIDQTTAEKVLSDLESRSTLWMSGKVRRTAREALAKIFGAQP